MPVPDVAGVWPLRVLPAQRRLRETMIVAVMARALGTDRIPRAIVRMEVWGRLARSRSHDQTHMTNADFDSRGNLQSFL
jgi:hypothetical protein